MDLLPLKKKAEEIEIRPLKAEVETSSLTHRDLLDGAFWQKIPAYRDVSEAEFLDHRFQMKHTITRPDKLLQTVQDLVPVEFYRDVEQGFLRSFAVGNVINYTDHKLLAVFVNVQSFSCDMHAEIAVSINPFIFKDKIFAGIENFIVRLTKDIGVRFREQLEIGVAD